MNPGPVEEAGKAVGGFMEVMKSQPLALALVVMNLSLLIIFWLILDKIDTHNTARERQQFEQQKHTAELLARCIVPAKPEGG